MSGRFFMIGLALASALALSACGRSGSLEPPPGREHLATTPSAPPSPPQPVLRPAAEPLLPHPRIAPEPPTPENTKPKSKKPQRSFFLDPLL
jgi:predicted small lipoprotein YifL